MKYTNVRIWFHGGARKFIQRVDGVGDGVDVPVSYNFSRELRDVIGTAHVTKDELGLVADIDIVAECQSDNLWPAACFNKWKREDGSATFAGLSLMFLENVDNRIKILGEQIQSLGEQQQKD